MALSAASVVSKTMKAWPFARRFFLATMSIMVPYWAKMDCRVVLRRGMAMDSSRLRICKVGTGGQLELCDWFWGGVVGRT